MTLIEVLLVSGLAVCVAAAVGAFTLFSGRSFVALQNYGELQRADRPALDRISKDIRQAHSCSTNSLSPTALTLFGTNVVSLLPYTSKYDYSSNSMTLTRTYSDATGTFAATLLSNCSYFSIAYFQRNPTNGTYDVYPVDDPSRPDLCKLIQFNWTCSRSIFGKTANTESVQSARVVIRKG